MSTNLQWNYSDNWQRLYPVRVCLNALNTLKVSRYLNSVLDVCFVHKMFTKELASAVCIPLVLLYQREILMFQITCGYKYVASTCIINIYLKQKLVPKPWYILFLYEVYLLFYKLIIIIETLLIKTLLDARKVFNRLSVNQRPHIHTHTDTYRDLCNLETLHFLSHFGAGL